jgi:HSP20 family protein
MCAGAQPSQRRRIGGGAANEPGMVPPGAIGVTPNVVGSAGYTRSIPVDFISREKEYIVRADIPGVHKDELHVEVHDKNVLRFGHNPFAEREKEDEEEPGIFLRAERVSSFRNRNLRMPDDADMEGPITARYEDGVLEISIQKKKVEEGAGAGTKTISVE